MKILRPFRRGSRGFALITVLVFIAVMAILTASVLKYSGSERRLNERNRLVLRARNMAENVALYASEQLTTKLYRLRNTAEMAFMTGSNRIYLPPDDVLTTAYSTPADVEVRAGLRNSTGLQYVDPTDTANASDPNVGLSVDKSEVPIVAKATMRHPLIGEVTAYAEQDLQIAMIPLFQFAVFYNMDMEFGPGPDMIISGPVHTNGNLIARIQTGKTATLQFKERVTAAGGFYANTAHKGKTYMGDGSVDDGPGGTGPLYFQNLSGTVTNIKNGPGVWRDYKFGSDTETDTTRSQFRTFATSTYAGNFRTSVHGVTPLELPSIGGYKEVDDPDTENVDETKNGRQLIERPEADDAADLKQAKLSRRSGLYIVVNPDDETRVGKLPNGSSVAMRARSYRAWLNTVNNDGSHSLAEVILPGQPSWGALNVNLNKLPNVYREDTSVGHNQVLRIPQGGGVDPSNTGYADATVPAFPARNDAYFYDLRRGKGSNSYPFTRTANNFIPRPIAKIDFDMTRFKMAVERTLLDATTSTVYYPSFPTSETPPSLPATWANSIFNPAATPTNFGLGLGLNFTDTSGASTLKVYQQNGNGSVSEIAGRFIIAESTEDSDNPTPASFAPVYTSSSDELSPSSYVPSATAKTIRIRYYVGGEAPNANDDGNVDGDNLPRTDATTRMRDEQFIKVLPVDGTTTVRTTLSNDYHIVASSNGQPGNEIKLEYANTEMRVYVGGVDDTANWTITPTVISGTVAGSMGSGANFNRYQIASPFTTDKAKVRLRATKGTSTYDRYFTIEKQRIKNVFDTPANKTVWMDLGRSGVRRVPGAGGDPFRIYFAPADPDDVRIASDPSVFEVGAADLVNVNSPCPWFDGITVYVHSVDAEDKDLDVAGNPERVDSGVRLWNARGSVISLNGAVYPGRTGLSFVSNDSVYIVGHFNADGSINSNVNSKGNPGGYSGRYAESSTEMLCAVMGDAISILSQPIFTEDGSSYYQTDGWADSLSAHRRSSGGWASTWQSGNPSGSNSVDGIDTSLKPACMPNLTRNTVNNSGPAAAGNVTTKLDPSVTEVSTCLLTGIVRTRNTTEADPEGKGAQTSGGVHTFPRMIENWAGTGLYIRGSMVAMFESQVGTEPWSIRHYQGAGRYWGLHQNLRAENGAHDLPLEPIVLNAHRLRYRELDAAGYAAKKALIEALPH